MSTCRGGCGLLLPNGTGHCLPCAVYKDGFDSGAVHCDDFEGTTREAALAYSNEWSNEAFDFYASQADGDVTEALREAFVRGRFNGLCAAAYRRAENDAVMMSMIGSAE